MEQEKDLDDLLQISSTNGIETSYVTDNHLMVL